MLDDKVQITFDLKLRAKPVHRTPVVMPPSFSAHKDLWTEISITLIMRNIRNYRQLNKGILHRQAQHIIV